MIRHYPQTPRYPTDEDIDRQNEQAYKCRACDKWFLVREKDKIDDKSLKEKYVTCPCGAKKVIVGY